MDENSVILSISNKKKKKIIKKNKEIIQTAMSSILTPLDDSRDALETIMPSQLEGDQIFQIHQLEFALAQQVQTYKKEKELFSQLISSLLQYFNLKDYSSEDIISFFKQQLISELSLPDSSNYLVQQEHKYSLAQEQQKLKNEESRQNEQEYKMESEESNNLIIDDQNGKSLQQSQQQSSLIKISLKQLNEDQVQRGLKRQKEVKRERKSSKKVNKGKQSIQSQQPNQQQQIEGQVYPDLKMFLNSDSFPDIDNSNENNKISSEINGKVSANSLKQYLGTDNAQNINQLENILQNIDKREYQDILKGVTNNINIDQLSNYYQLFLNNMNLMNQFNFNNQIASQQFQK